MAVSLFSTLYCLFQLSSEAFRFPYNGQRTLLSVADVHFLGWVAGYESRPYVCGHEHTLVTEKLMEGAYCTKKEVNLVANKVESYGKVAGDIIVDQRWDNGLGKAGQWMIRFFKPLF